MSDFKQATEAFLTWFTTRPGALFHQNIQLTDLRSKGEGRGIVATADIPTETELFTIPRSGILSTETSTLAKKLPHLLSTLKYAEGNSGKDDGDDDEDEEMVEMPDPWLDLILIMIYEYLQGDVSAWKLYFDVLPTEFDTPMFWESSELDELQASVVKDRIGKASADEMFTTKILPAVKGHEEVFYPSGVAKLSDEELVGLAHRMGSIIMAYAFDLDPEDDDEEDEEDGWVQDADVMKKMGMVPMADMLNADAEFNVSDPACFPGREICLILTGTSQSRRRTSNNDLPPPHKSRRRDPKLLRPTPQLRPPTKIRLHEHKTQSLRRRRNSLDPNKINSRLPFRWSASQCSR